jgi:hypothetical protein
MDPKRTQLPEFDDDELKPHFQNCPVTKKEAVEKAPR